MGGKISLDRQKAEDKTFLLSRDGTFFLSFANGAFGSKWAGLWNNETKFLDYFAVRAEKNWLSPESFKKINYDGISAELEFKNKVSEKLCVNKDGLALELRSKKPIDWDVEVGVNIRKRDEDLHGREYEVFKRSGTVVKNSLGYLKIKSPNAHFIPIKERGKHFPGKYAHEKGYDWYEDEQEKYVAGVLSGHDSKLEIGFLVNSNKDVEYDAARKSYRKVIRAHKEEGWKFSSSINHLLTKINGMTGFFAGLPYFNQFWTRDFLWMARPLMDAGFDKEAHDALGHIAKNQLKNGEIPSIIGSKGGNADSTPLFVVASDEVFLETGEINGQNVRAALDFGIKNQKEFVYHPENLTWMDTLNRPVAIEVQSLWVEAFERGFEIFDDEKLSDAASDLWEAIENRMTKNEVFLDSLGGPYQFTANSLVPIVFGQASLGQRKKTIKKAKSELLTEWGVKAVAKSESKNPEKYHERVWGITTYWGLLAFSEKISRKILEGYSKLYGKKTLYGMPETISQGKPLGATHQLWSVAFLPEIGDDVV